MIQCTLSHQKNQKGNEKVISPVHEISNELNLDVRTPKDLSNDLNFKSKKFNLAIVTAYGQIIPDTLKECQFINIHASLLPKWRGQH